ncbi:MAG: alpha-L-fucosidase [Bacteroidales bacterium]|jgi:alpha-L-fucosidase|nr:alpha-L-fucosidase [Bacteroidales bacterium]
MRLDIVLFTGLLAGACAQVTPPAPAGPVPTERQLRWHRMERNAFIHFTVNTFTDKEWGYGDESPEVFNPDTIDARQWVSVLKETGFKGVILTCKHHDGFCLWPTKYSDHNISHSPYAGGKGDVVRAVADACHEFGLQFGVYLSPWDRNRADYASPSYIEYYRNQLTELFTTYGPVFEMWFDGANGGDGFYGGAREKRRIDGRTYYDWPNTLKLIRDIEPEVLFFSDAGPDLRWMGNERGVMGETNWCTITPDTLYAGKPGLNSLLNSGAENGTHWIPGETDVSIRPGWFYHASEDDKVKNPQRLFEIYLTSVGRGSTLLLNMPPSREGVIHENDVAALRGFQALLDSVFAVDLAANASVSASNTRGRNDSYAAKNVIDSNPDTYWATDDKVLNATLEIDLGEAKTLNFVELQEYIQLGQRIKAFHIEAWTDNQWQEVAKATTIGYKRILRIAPVTASKVRISFDDAKACPVISSVKLF